MNWRLMFFADLALMFLARFMGQDNPKQISMVDSSNSAIFLSLSFILDAACRQICVFGIRKNIDVKFTVCRVSSFTHSLALTYDYV